LRFVLHIVLVSYYGNKAGSWKGNKMSELHLYITETQRIMRELSEARDDYERRELRIELAETIAWGNDIFTAEQIATGWAMSLEEVNA